MPTTLWPYAPDQSFLLPPSPRVWLPEGHLVCFISETVDALDLSEFYRPYEGDGRRNQPFDPKMLVKVLLYVYATGTFSSRRIARRIEEDVAYRVLAAGNFPAHRTICEFRQLHLAAFGKLFVQVVRIAREAGVAKLGTLAVDGSKVKANAPKHKAMSYRRMLQEEQTLREQIAALTAQAEAADAPEDAEFGPEVRGDEPPVELQRREQRLEKILAAKRRLEACRAAKDRAKGLSQDDDRKSPRGGPRFKRDFGVPEDKAQDNFTDPQSRIMKTSSGYDQCYNGQIAVDEGSHLIVATAVPNNAADNNELIPLLNEARSNLGRIQSRFWRMRATAPRPTSKRSRRGTSTPMYRWAAKGRSHREQLRLQRPSEWKKSLAAKLEESATEGARRSSSRSSAGSKTCLVSGDSVSAARKRPDRNGPWSAWRST